MHCTYCGMLKGTSSTEVTSNSEKIKLLALTIVELCWSEGISQSVNQSDRQTDRQTGKQAGRQLFIYLVS